ncbi:PQQ-binding-like beta-propeller repeat protein [Segniliparus rugosus]|uniref:Rv3212 family protein n=1 Tax=Segniliparus rugosus TaxID=286804 RepID=UPI0001F03F5A|nr:PQQ-binding-like beta-propeller repeat protein [Segniliparus rugosus]
MIATSLALTVLVVAAVLWWRAPDRQAVSRTASRPAPAPRSATDVPEGFQLAWSKPDGAGTYPMVVGGTLVTADGGVLTGWEVATGKELWRYAQPAPICAATVAWGKVYAVYREQRGCSLVVSLDATTGARAKQLHADARSSAADQRVRLITTVPSEGAAPQDDSESSDSQWYSHMILAVGPRRVELWHEDLLRSVEYGYVATPFEPKQQPHPGCALRSAGIGEETFAVLERCPRDTALRLSFLKITPKKDTKPEQTYSAVIPQLGSSKDVRLLAVRGSRADLYVPASDSDGAKILEVDGRGVVEKSFDLSLPVTNPDTRPWRTTPDLITWWTGAGVVGISPLHLSPLFQIPDLVGPVTEMAHQLIAPTATGIAVLDASTGAKLREIATEGAGPSQAGARLAVCGSTVLRQQDGRVLAYAPTGRDPRPR